MTETNLLPCPFCGGEAETHEVTFPYHYWDVRCDGECFDHFCEKPTEAKAIEAWNTRYEPTWGDLGKMLDRATMAETRISKIVRCVDCKHFTPRGTYEFENGIVNDDCCPIVRGWKAQVTPDGFCAWGERK